jgi:hypothetical protein
MDGACGACRLARQIVRERAYPFLPPVGAAEDISAKEIVGSIVAVPPRIVCHQLLAGAMSRRSEVNCAANRRIGRLEHVQPYLAPYLARAG